jgi:hypothetical protein
MPNEAVLPVTEVELGENAAAVGTLLEHDSLTQRAIIFAARHPGEADPRPDAPRVVVRFRDVSAVDALIATARRVRQSLVMRGRLQALVGREAKRLYPS